MDDLESITNGSDRTGIGEVTAGAENLDGVNRDGFGWPHAQGGSGDCANATLADSRQEVRLKNDGSRMESSPNFVESPVLEGRGILTSKWTDRYRLPEILIEIARARAEEVR